LLTFVEPAPAGDPGALAHHVLVLLGNADGDDVGLELDGLVEAEERQVVLERLRVELLVGSRWRLSGPGINTLLKKG